MPVPFANCSIDFYRPLPPGPGIVPTATVVAAALLKPWHPLEGQQYVDYHGGMIWRILVDGTFLIQRPVEPLRSGLNSNCHIVIRGAPFISNVYFQVMSMVPRMSGGVLTYWYVTMRYGNDY